MIKYILILLLFTSSLCYAQISAVGGYSFINNQETASIVAKTSYGLIWFNYTGGISVTNYINISKNKKGKTNLEASISLISDSTYSGGARFTAYVGKLLFQPYFSYNIKDVYNSGVRLVHPIYKNLGSDLIIGYKNKEYIIFRLIYKLPI